MTSPWSIRLRLLAINLAVSLVLLVAISAAMVQLAADLTRQNSAKQYQQIVDVLEQDLIRALVFSKPDQISDLMHKLGAFSSLKNLYLYKRDGTPLLAYHREKGARVTIPPTHALEQQKTFDGNVLIAQKPLVFENQPYGAARLELELPDPQEFMQQIVPHLAWLIPVLLLLSFVLAMTLQAPITHPLAWLTENLQKMARQQRYDLPIPQRGNDEIGQLYTGVRELVYAVQHAQKELQSKLNQLQYILDHIQDMIVQFDEYGTVLSINPAGLALLQLEQGARLHIEQFVLLPRQDTEPLDLTNLASQVKKSIQLTGLKLITPNHEQEVEIYLAAETASEPGRKYLLIVHPVSEDQQLQAELERQATTDPLTGLANRLELERQLNLFLRQNRPFYLLHVDVDHFHLVNETLSHEQGDLLLVEVAQTLQLNLPDKSILARIGGDEFGILVPEQQGRSIQALAAELAEAIQSAESLQQTSNLSITVSIGIAASKQAQTLSDLLKNAHASRQMAKQEGGNRYHLYQENDERLIQHNEELTLYTRVIEALNNHRVVLYFQRIQPAYPSDQSRLHFETLARIHCENGTILPPGLFMPVAERYQLAIEVDLQVIQGVFDWFEQHSHLLDSVEMVSINLSGSSLGNERLERTILALLDKGPLKAEQLCFELTETSAISNASATRELMHTLKKRGCRFSLDDFGSGMSSLAYLKYFPVDFLKLDGSFVREITLDPTNQSLVRIFSNIGQVFGMTTIAEFVESDEIRKLLVEMGIDLVQGYAVHKPEPFERMLENQENKKGLQEQALT